MNDLGIILSAIFGVASYPPGASFGPRSMADWEFVWLIQGEALYRWGDLEVAAAEGSVVLCRPGATDSFQWDRERRTRHGFFHFGMAHPPPGWEEWPLARPAAEGDILPPLFRHLLTWLGHGDPESCLQAVRMMVAVFRTGNQSAERLPPEAWPTAVETACAFLFRRLDADPAAHLTLADLADAACVTPEHLCRLFKSSVGHSPAETVRLARLDRAAALLARSNYPVGEVAALCGFASPFHFSRLFKSACGLPPREFRRRAQAGEVIALPQLVQVTRLLLP